MLLSSIYLPKQVLQRLNGTGSQCDLAVREFALKWYSSAQQAGFSTVQVSLKIPRMSAAHSVTLLLDQWNHGDREALDKLMPLIYEELRKMARRYMSQQNPGHTLQTTL